MFSWFRRRRRRKLLARPAEPIWAKVMDELGVLRGLADHELAELLRIARVFAAEKNWEGCGGQELTPEVKPMIALQACLLILHRDHDHFKNVRSIFVYPSTYKNPHARGSGDGTVREGSSNLGEAWHRGPVVIAYDAAKLGGISGDGRNVVLHEFAHKLDFQDGVGDGTPVLEERHDYERWKRVMTESFEALRDRLEAGKVTLLDDYAATNAAEFFAVSTEYFFERAVPLSRRHPELYALLRDFYEQDPAAREDDD